jgi:hypothetical protein
LPFWTVIGPTPPMLDSTVTSCGLFTSHSRFLSFYERPPKKYSHHVKSSPSYGSFKVPDPSHL